MLLKKLCLTSLFAPIACAAMALLASPDTATAGCAVRIDFSDTSAANEGRPGFRISRTPGSPILNYFEYGSAGNDGLGFQRITSSTSTTSGTDVLDFIVSTPRMELVNNLGADGNTFPIPDSYTLQFPGGSFFTAGGFRIYAASDTAFASPLLVADLTLVDHRLIVAGSSGTIEGSIALNLTNIVLANGGDTYATLAEFEAAAAIAGGADLVGNISSAGSNLSRVILGLDPVPFPSRCDCIEGSASGSIFGDGCLCDAGGPYNAECEGGTTSVQLDASNSGNPNPTAPLQFFWTSTCPGAVFNNNRIANPTITFNNGGDCNFECTVTVRITSTAGVAKQCSASIRVTDSTNPVLVMPPDLQLECDAPTAPANTGTAEANDSCDPAPTVSHEDAETPGNCAGARTITRTWTAMDRCNNSASMVQTITLVDTTPPTIVCPPNITVSPGGSTDPSATGSARANDNCDPSPDVSSFDEYTPRTCPQPGTILRTWTATDECGHSVSCVQEITVPSTGAVPTGGQRYRLHNHPDGQARSPLYGLRLDELTNATSGHDIFTFNFDDSRSAMYMDIVGSTIHIFGRSYGGLDTGSSYGNSNHRGVYLIDFVYNGASTVVGDDDTVVNGPDGDGPNSGTITPTFGSNRNPIPLRDNAMGGYSFRFGNENNDLGHRGFNGLSGWGWLSHSGRPHVNASDWLFTAARSNDIVCQDNPPPCVPELICPPSVSVGCGDSTHPNVTGRPMVTVCCGEPCITYCDRNYGCGCPRTIVRTWTVRDGCGQSYSCEQTIRVRDCQSRVLFVVPNRDCLDSQDNAKKCLFENWGYRVTTISETASPAAFLVAASTVDVIYVSENVNSTAIASKLTDVAVGVVSEEPALLDDLKFQPAAGESYTGSRRINIINNTHYVTSGLSTGNVTIVSGDTELAQSGPSLATGVTLLARRTANSNPTLGVIDMNAQRSDGSPSPGRRVTLPWGGGNFDITKLNSSGQRILRRSLEWAGAVGGNPLQAPSNRVLMVVPDSANLTNGDDQKLNTMIVWGYQVVLINQGDSSNTFRDAAALSKVAYISENVSSSSVNTKLTNVTIGVVSEDPFLVDDLRFQSSNGSTYTGSRQINVINNSHFITQTLSTGNQNIANNNIELTNAGSTIASGASLLANKVGANNRVLFAVDRGGRLIDNSTARGRRVGLPFGGDNFDFGQLNDTGLTIMRRSIEWARN